MAPPRCDVELLTGAQCQEYCGTNKISAALLDRRAGTINPMGYTRAWRLPWRAWVASCSSSLRLKAWSVMAMAGG